MFDSYNKVKLVSLLNDFYCVTKIKTVLYDSNFSVIAAVPFSESSFCTAMSENIEARQMCAQCNTAAFYRCRQKMGTEIYHCHAGLVEAISPIRIGDIIVGYIMFGQILEKEDDVKSIIEYASRYIGSKAADFIVDFIPRTKEEIRSSSKIMEALVCYMLMNKLIGEKQGSLIFEISKYIEQNPTADLSVGTLCSLFGISRNNLYSLSETYFGMPIAEYVRLKRLRIAELLLKKGEKVSSAAEKTGFYDYGYFGKIFKRYIGKTPMQVRKSDEINN